jgi:uncharacterized membrane protein
MIRPSDPDYHEEIVRLEEQIDKLAATTESCRKFILAGRILMIGGAAVLLAIFIGVLQFNSSVLVLAIAAVLGGIVASGSSHSTAKEATHQLKAIEAKRTALIGEIELRLVSDRDGLRDLPHS